MHCPAFGNLVEFVDGLGSEDERKLVERHLADGCAECLSAVGWYAEVRAAALADRSPDPPPALTARTLGAIRDARDAASRRGLRGFVARIAAVLVADSLSLSPVGARGQGEARQLLYSAVPFDVDLLVAEAREPRRLRVTGQVLTLDEGAFEEVVRLAVELERDGQVAWRAETSSIGEFEFLDVAPGRYQIRIFGGRREIVLADVPIALE